MCACVCVCMCARHPCTHFPLLGAFPPSHHLRTSAAFLIAGSRAQLNICKNRNQGEILFSYNVYGSSFGGDNVYGAIPSHGSGNSGCYLEREAKNNGDVSHSGGVNSNRF